MNREMRRHQAKEEERAKKRRSDGPRSSKKGSDEKLSLWARTVKYFKEVRSELKKVAWPSQAELRTYTIVVFGMTTVITLFVFALDWGFNKLVISVLDAIT
ncbi:MAG: preprotein translocase subunit SecE [Acidimicrobiia bacterium]